MKMNKRFTILYLLIILIMTMCFGCKADKEDVFGKWQASGTYNGNYYVHTLVLNEDNTYIRYTSKNEGTPKVDDSGEFEIEGNIIKCYESDCIVYKGAWVEYTFKNGQLKNGRWEYKKIS